MNCEQLAALYEEYALGVLEGEERAELEAHLARACPTVHPRRRQGEMGGRATGSRRARCATSGSLRGKIMDAIKSSAADAARTVDSIRRSRSLQQRRAQCSRRGPGSQPRRSR